MLALASAQNTDPVLDLSPAVKSANELLITPVDAAATVLPSITPPAEEVFTVLAITPAAEAATVLALAHVEEASLSPVVVNVESAAIALAIVVCLPGH